MKPPCEKGDHICFVHGFLTSVLRYSVLFIGYESIIFKELNILLGYIMRTYEGKKKNLTVSIKDVNE